MGKGVSEHTHIQQPLDSYVNQNNLNNDVYQTDLDNHVNQLNLNNNLNEGFDGANNTNED